MLSFFVLFAVFEVSFALGISNNVYRLNAQDFAGNLRDKDIMLVEFYAPWCHHCQELSPELDAAADQMAAKNQFVFGKVDCVNDGKDLCQRFNIQGYPTLKLFRYGKYIGDYVGQRDRGALMQYVDSVTSIPSQNAPLTSGVAGPASLAQAMFPLHHPSPNQGASPDIAPNYINEASMHAKNPSLMASFYGSAQTHYPANAAAYLGGTSPAPQGSSPDTLQSKFGNLASLDVYRSKLKMIAAYKNYQRRLKEYRLKLTAFSRGEVNPSPHSFPGAVTKPPRPGVNSFAQPQTYRGYYRPEALAAQNVQINRAYPQAAYGNYPSQFASQYGYQAQASPYYRSKMAASRRHQNRKHKKPVNKPALPVHYDEKTPQQQQQFHQNPSTEQQRQALKPALAVHYDEKTPQQQQRFHQNPPTEQQRQALKPALAVHYDEKTPQQQQQFHQNPSTEQQQQAFNKPQAPQPVTKAAPQPVVKPAPPIPAELSNSLKITDTSALKDLKADIESAIQDALKNAVTRVSNTAKSSPPLAHVDGARAKPQATTSHLDQMASGSGVPESQASPARGPVGIDGDGSGSGL